MINQKKSAFKRYAPFIKEYIYRKGWSELYDIQEEACDAILDSDLDVILASGTATGKTEAVLFPILTELQKNPSNSVSVLYISPLKALINDQYKRLSELLEDSEFPIWPWHGDISQSIKNKAKKVKKGIIQITPESLEALLIRNPDIVKELFSDLRYIIIDEIHALMGTDRGLQVISQINRIERISRNRPRRIGLSATLSDYNQVKNYLSSGKPENVISLGLNNNKQTIGIRVECFSSFQPGSDIHSTESFEYIYERTKNNKTIIFTNSRKEAEAVITALKRLSKLKHTPDIYRIHHGSLSAKLRKETENELKNTSKPITTAATLTLELGIDIGSLDQTIQIGAPFSCSNFVQRLGRSGRVTGKSLMRFITSHDVNYIQNPQDMPWELLRAIAIIELYSKEKWIEPFTIKRKPYSLLIHQTLSVLTSFNELRPDELARYVLTLDPFKGRITQDEYKNILNHLIKLDYIQKLENGSLIIGLAGEKTVNHYSFYAVFSEGEEYRVVYKGNELGTVQSVPALGQVISIGGSSWHVVEINDNSKTIFVEKDTKFQTPYWTSSGIEINGRIMEKIKEILSEDINYSYLSEEASKVLKEARRYARESGMLIGISIPESLDGVFLFPWCGTKELRTLVLLFRTAFKQILKVKRVIPFNNYLFVYTSLPIGIFLKILKNLNFESVYYDNVVSGLGNQSIDKFDSLLPDNLKTYSIFMNKYDLYGAREALRKLTSNLEEFC